LIELYEELASESYKNSLKLLSEANLLYRHRAYARAYSLAVLSAEEFAKSFLARAYSVGVITDPRFIKDLLSHKLKLVHFLVIVITGVFINENYATLMEGVRRAKRDSNSADRILKESFDAATKGSETINQLLAVFGDGDRMKQNGFYVGLAEDKISAPSWAIGRLLAKEALDLLDSTIRGQHALLRFDEAKFRILVGALDPVLLTGTVMPEEWKRRLKHQWPSKFQG
jgi:AbiV family abortive infection protein